MDVTHLTFPQLNDGLDEILRSPIEEGTVELLVIRPEENRRATPERVEVSPGLGMHGDRWSTGKSRDNANVQITMINSRLLQLVSGAPQRWSLAGDNMVVDLDLSQQNLMPGQKLETGSAVLEITDTPHTGCHKFSSRFGADALRLVNLGQGKDLRLRGIYARVLQPGWISVGDRIQKL